jgi:mannose-1-phosphate guanylyltransferase
LVACIPSILGGMAQRFIVIIAGGKGERFWPQSRSRRPKHLLPIVGQKPLLTQTLDRVSALVPSANVYVITSAVQANAVRSCCPSLPSGNVVVEPVGRDTAPAVVLASVLIESRDPHGVFAVLPADHVIHDRSAYLRDLDAAFKAAETADVLVTIGIKPHEPATGFGYIQQGKPWKRVQRRPFFHVRRFVEKPPLKLAQAYLKSGDYVWNAGMFVWSVPTVLASFQQHAPALIAGIEPVRRALARGRPLRTALTEVYPQLEKISVDYALLEKSDRVVVLPASFDWDDVGAWPAVVRHQEADSQGNVSRGRVVIEQGRNNIVVTEDGHLVALLGLDECVVVHTRDATLVIPKSRCQEIKTLIKRLEVEKDGAQWL